MNKCLSFYDAATSMHHRHNADMKKACKVATVFAL